MNKWAELNENWRKRRDVADAEFAEFFDRFDPGWRERMQEAELRAFCPEI